jgi:DNA gyrase subunit B
MSEYNSSQISSLSDLEAIRKRSGMYIGEAKNPSHLFQEVIDNAVDELMARHASKTVVHIDTESNLCTIEDDGRGFPMGTMKVEIMGHVFEKQSLEMLVSKTHTGGKLGGKGYSVSSGLNGVGLKALSALSEFFAVETQRTHDDTGKQTRGYIEYSRGKLVDHRYEEIQGTKTGSKVSFRGDPEIFQSVEIPRSYVEVKCKLIKAFGHDISLIVDGENVDLGEQGLQTLLSFEDTSPISDFIELESTRGEELVKVAIQYAGDLTYTNQGFSNMIYNSQGGTHCRLMERMIVEGWVEVADKDQVSKLKYNDYLIGCRSLIACFILEPSYSSQTKERLVVDNKVLQPFMSELKSKFVQYLRRNPEIKDRMLAKFVAYRNSQNTLLNSKEIRGLVKVAELAKDGKVRRKSIVEGLIECTNPIPGETELFITEGNSALGSIQQARDPRIHAGLPLRGKTLNVAGSSLVDAVKNREMLGMVNSVGCGLGDESDHKKSRYGKIIITADSDPDGLHIQNLVITALVMLIPDVVKAGMVYLAPGYLYGYYLKDGSFYGCNSKSEIPKEAVRWSRYKGLGELNPSEFYAFYMNKETRVLKRVDYPESIEDFKRVMIQSKKDLLVEDGVIISNR